MFGIRDHRTAVRCTSLHRFPAAAIFYPNFYPKQQRSGAEIAYLLVTGTDWSRRPEYASSFPSWSSASIPVAAQGPSAGSLRLVLVALLVLILAEVLLRGGHCPVDLFIVLMMDVTLGEPRYFVDPLVGLLQVLLGVGLRLVR